MLVIAFLCFAVLVLAWLAAPGEPVVMRSLLPITKSEDMPADVELQH